MSISDGFIPLVDVRAVMRFYHDLIDTGMIFHFQDIF